MMDIVEKVARKASSRNLQGRLLLIREASFLLAGMVAEICSPDSFYTMQIPRLITIIHNSLLSNIHPLKLTSLDVLTRSEKWTYYRLIQEVMSI